MIRTKCHISKHVSWLYKANIFIKLTEGLWVLTFHNAYLHIFVLQHTVHYSAVAVCDVVFLITLSVCWCRGMGYVPAGEGYECTVTVDDEDSKVIVFDNWQQVSCRPSAPQSLCLVYRVQFRPTPRLFVLWWPLALLKSHLTFFSLLTFFACTSEMEKAICSISVMGELFVGIRV